MSAPRPFDKVVTKWFQADVTDVEQPPRATLVLLPGLDGTDVLLRPLIAELPRWIRPVVICYPAASHTYAELVEVVRRATSDIPDMWILASSFGGPLAVMLAAAEPQRVRGVILCASVLRSPQRRLNRFKFAAIGPIIWTVRATRRIPVWTLRGWNDALRVAKAETWRRVSARALAARVRAIVDVDARESLRRCTQPFLCVQFEHDRVVPHHNAEEIQRCAAAIKLVMLPGNHFSMFTGPATIAEEVVRFMTNTKVSSIPSSDGSPSSGLVSCVRGESHETTNTAR
jgi:pimeloyl-ACP methyl ester carboxylesterase